MQIDCPFCFCLVMEENMARHIEWHYPGDEDESISYEPEPFEAGSQKQIIDL